MPPVPPPTPGQALPRPGPRVVIATLGCKLNQADSDRLAEQFAAAGYVLSPPDAPADVFILNTCTVTHVADAKARQELRAARRRRPAALVVATGCMVQRDPQAAAALPGVDLAVGNDRKRELVGLVGARLAARGMSGLAAVAPPSHEDGPVKPAPGRTRVFIAVQEGCNDACAFCIVPRVRGRSRSIAPTVLVERVRAAVERGAREVVLTGTQLTDYGLEQPGRRSIRLGHQHLADLFRRLLRETGIERLRVSSLQPQDLTPALLDVWSDARMCRHLHLPLQSGSDRVLTVMRRRYNRGDFLRAVEAARTAIPGVAITTDVIAGFPGETEDDFRATLDLCREAGFAALHVFPYSPRAGTAAARLPDQLPDGVRRDRAVRLGELGRALSEAYRRGMVGQRAAVLWERPSNGPDGPLATGLTDTYVRVYARPGTGAQGDITDVTITSLDRDGVRGE